MSNPIGIPGILRFSTARGLMQSAEATDVADEGTMQTRIEAMQALFWEVKLVCDRFAVRRSFELFFSIIDPTFNINSVEADPPLLPNAVHASGWKHGFDNLLRRSISSLHWWPRFVWLFKGVCGFFRSLDNLEQTCKFLKRAGIKSWRRNSLSFVFTSGHTGGGVH